MLKFILPLLALTATAPAYAQDGKESVKVSLADLDLSTAEGQKAAKGRVRKAVRSLCAAGPFASITERWQARQCTTNAHASTRNTMLAAVRRARSERAGGAVLAGR